MVDYCICRLRREKDEKNIDMNYFSYGKRLLSNEFNRIDGLCILNSNWLNLITASLVFL
jgi:hypothetical protein